MRKCWTFSLLSNKSSLRRIIYEKRKVIFFCKGVANLICYAQSHSRALFRDSSLLLPFDALMLFITKRESANFFLQYHMPSFSSSETSKQRGNKRRQNKRLQTRILYAENMLSRVLLCFGSLLRVFSFFIFCLFFPFD